MNNLLPICSRISFLVFLFAVLFILSACSPVIRTSYIYQPPPTRSGEACVFQCEQIKTQCEKIDNLEYEQCQTQAERNYRSCERGIRRSYNRRPKWYECFRDSCSDESGNCFDTYQVCYAKCGGTITPVQKCVSFCDKLTPAQKQELSDSQSPGGGLSPFLD